MGLFLTPSLGRTVEEAFQAAWRADSLLHEHGHGLATKTAAEVILHRQMTIKEAINIALRRIEAEPFIDQDYPFAGALRCSGSLWLFFGRYRDNGRAPGAWEAVAALRDCPEELTIARPRGAGNRDGEA